MTQVKKWIVAVQTTYNCVKYQTSDGDIKYPSYTDFLTLMMQYNVYDPSNFKKQVDSFKPLFIDLDTGNWDIVELKRNAHVPFETLYDLNKEDETLNTFDSMVERGKKFIFTRKKNERK